MKEIIINLKNISDIEIQKLNKCLQNNHYIKSYHINSQTGSIIIYTKHSFRVPDISNHLTQNGYKIKSVSLQKEEQSIPLIEALTDKTEIDKEVIRENNSFDLENFYVNNLEGAIGVITKDKTIFANAVIDHYTALNCIYNFLYNKLNTFKNYYDLRDDRCWQEVAVSFGNIVIQFCSDVPSTVWLPEEINSYQQKELQKIIDQINTISQKHNLNIDLEIGKPSDFLTPSGTECEQIQNNSKTL